MQQYMGTPKPLNCRFELMGLAKTGNTHLLIQTWQGVAREETESWVVQLVWHRIELNLRFKPWPLAGYLDLLLTVLFPPPYICQKLLLRCLQHISSTVGDVDQNIHRPQTRGVDKTLMCDSMYGANSSLRQSWSCSTRLHYQLVT